VNATTDLSETFAVTTPSDREIRMTRLFDAPRALLFEAHTKPEHLARWWGPRTHKMVQCEMDFRPGGKYRFVLRTENGKEYAFRGEFREIVPPERLAWTFEYEGMPGHISVETLTFTEKDGKTLLTATAVYGSLEERNGVMQSGMESGARESWDRLSELVATLA
jgi:uncharacterized protein YndB with AHSA1/START domain